MTHPVFHLYQLQKLDTILDSKRLRLAEIDAIIRNEKSVIEAQTSFDMAATNLSIAKKELTEIEDQIKTRSLKIEQSESSLYSGTIKNPKELQDIQKEIASLKGIIASLEEKELEKLVQIEELEQVHQTTEKILSTRQKEVLERNRSLIYEKENCELEITRLEIESRAVCDQVSSEHIDRYLELRKKKKGIAISIVEDGSCSICGGPLTPAECQAAKSPSSVSYCDSCGRILYAD